MNWNNLHEATAQNEKPTPGWLFQEICRDAQQYPQDMPDTAEYLMRCVACDNQTVCMKACLTVRHLADDVPEFRAYMQRCPEALAILKEISEPPQLAIAQSIERPETKVGREAAARALKSCLVDPSKQDAGKEQVKQRIQGFGNFAPPTVEEAQPTGLVDKVAGFVGDAVGDTIDDFREKGAVGAVKDGIADAADLILDGVGAVWDIFRGTKNKPPAPVEDRICRPADQMRGAPVSAQGLAAYGQGMPGIYPGAAFMPGGAGVPGGFAPTPAAGIYPASAYMPGGGAPSGFAPPPAAAAASSSSAAGSFQGAFGSGVVGAGHTFHPAVLGTGGTYPPYGGGMASVAPSQAYAGSSAAAAAQEEPPAPAAAPDPPAPLMDLLSFEDEPGPSDLLSFGDEGGSSSAAGSSGAGGKSAIMELKSKGNDMVRQKKHSDAVKAYEAALAALEGQTEEEAGKLRAVLFANIALCYLQQQLYRRAVEAATASIRSDAGHAKGYYRRCLAYKALNMYDEARQDLEALQFCKHEMTEAEMHRLHSAISAGGGGS